jgi:hypothetical protein
VILDRTIVLAPTHARVVVPVKTPILALTVAHGIIVVSKFRMTDFPVLNPWSRIALLPLDLVVIPDRTIVLAPTHARVLVPVKTPVLALTVAPGRIVVSRFRMTDLPALNQWSRIF